jgi:hypothetical protein
MQPLTQDDLLSMPEYLSRRQEFYDAHRRYRERYRRVRVGPRVSLLFENRQTLWFRVQEFLRLARISDRQQIQHHLDWFNLLLPRPNRLQTAFVLDIDDEAHWYREFDYWRDLKGQHVRLWLDDESVTAGIITARHEDRSLGIAHWLEFPIGDDVRMRFADTTCAIRFEVDYKRYTCYSAHLNDDVRDSLIDDVDVASRAA